LKKTFDSIRYQRRQEGNENFDGGKEMTIKKIFQVYTKQAEKRYVRKNIQKLQRLIKNAKNRENMALERLTFDIDEKTKRIVA